MATTLLQLRVGSRRRADQENSSFVEDPELDGYINDGYRSLWDKLTTAHEDYFTSPTPTPFTLTTSNIYALPADFYKLRGVDKDAGGGEWEEVVPFEFNRRNQRSVSGRAGVEYRIMGASLLFTPAANAAGDYQLWLIPQCDPLVADGDTLNPLVEPWREYIETYAAIALAVKEESDSSKLEAKLIFLGANIDAAKLNRDVSKPQVIEDVYANRRTHGRRLF